MNNRKKYFLKRTKQRDALRHVHPEQRREGSGQALQTFDPSTSSGQALRTLQTLQTFDLIDFTD